MTSEPGLVVVARLCWSEGRQDMRGGGVEGRRSGGLEGWRVEGWRAEGRRVEG